MRWNYPFSDRNSREITLPPIALTGEMRPKWLVPVVLAAPLCWGQAPLYTADSIVNASDYSVGPFAPNSVLSIFGTNLSWSTAAYNSTQTAQSLLPMELAGAAVYVNSFPAPLLYVSPSQINFLIPGNEIPGNAQVRVVREGTSGPPVNLTLVNGAPALFVTGTGFAIATHLDGSLVNDTSPAHGGEYIVLYATGLGATDPNPPLGQIPQAAALLHWLGALSVSLDGAPLPASAIYYAGLTPRYAGLYQLNIQLPQNVAPEPAIQVSIGTQTCAGSLKIAVQ